MSDEDPDRIDPSDEYPLGPPGKSLAEHVADHPYQVYPLYHEPEPDEEPPEPFRFQFTLRQMLWTMTLVAVALSLLQCIPATHSKLIAAVAGISVLVTLALLEMAQPEDRRLYLAWWFGAALYVLSSITAIFRH